MTIAREVQIRGKTLTRISGEDVADVNADRAMDPFTALGNLGEAVCGMVSLA